jgi:hypothetical protein
LTRLRAPRPRAAARAPLSSSSTCTRPARGAPPCGRRALRRATRSASGARPASAARRGAPRTPRTAPPAWTRPQSQARASPAAAARAVSQIPHAANESASPKHARRAMRAPARESQHGAALAPPPCVAPPHQTRRRRAAWSQEQAACAARRPRRSRLRLCAVRRRRVARPKRSRAPRRRAPPWPWLATRRTGTKVGARGGAPEEMPLTHACKLTQAQREKPQAQRGTAEPRGGTISRLGVHPAARQAVAAACGVRCLRVSHRAAHSPAGVGHREATSSTGSSPGRRRTLASACMPQAAQAAHRQPGCFCRRHRRRTTCPHLACR